MTLPALYELAHEYRDAALKLADLDLDPQTVADTLESLSGDLEVKAQNVAMFALSLEATADAIKAHRDGQKAREDAIRHRAQSLREYLAHNLDAAGIQKIEGAGVRLSWRKSSAVVIDGVDLIPSDLMRTPEPPPPAPDKKAIADAIKGGREVPGAHIEQRKSLQIA